MSFSIATWNINSVRLRIDLVARFLNEHAPDLLCLQETKCRDAEFPLSAFHKLGYPHVEINGQKGYHGVAIASRLPLGDIDRRGFCEKGDARHLAVSFTPQGAARPVRLHNFYVPAGGDEPDPLINPKFAHKLAFLDEMAAWMHHGAIAASDAILVGDLNIAPLEADVWSHKALLRVVSHTPIEVEKFGVFQQAGPWVDAMRRYVPPEEKLYTWWSYRARDWALSGRGRRLDHVLVSESLAPRLGGMKVLTESRGWERPSDHVPVIVRFDA
ncbi:exodeoxyribonuclease III Xth [Methylocella silvestris BL2]|uniref:Exodeoxyribonuclease III Xth n=1 Tax=Methylocella silvestris (strain DSM 15510 / CIP 108128 / LMG 27833 / NCIMB 13906 / BL2) TaxID=395965 RepID=B8EQN8_METSB|nr:exodeoxyribonuclease III [Methylocella silvestris]ACK49309.1 exodeoxyribonuclease III Xth [Methylocella silvestris BL2]